MTDDGVDAETSLSLFLSLFMSISLLRLFSRAHYWVNKYILKMRVSSKELFLTLKGYHHLWKIVFGNNREVPRWPLYV